VIVHFIIHPQVTDAKLPGRNGIRPHRFSVACLHVGLVNELPIDCIEYDFLLACGKPSRVVLSLRRIFDDVGQSISLWVFRCQRRTALRKPAGSESPQPGSARPNNNTGTDEGEASYKVLRLSTTLDLAPKPAAWKSVQRIVAKVNPKIAQVDLDQSLDSSFVRNLEASGFLSEQRKKVK